ncbi:MAG TPA: hypothetical protein DDZ51_10150 [Planctomycetaceae bacterium]|nr:hypothetical protein [Planctomycetaceae bacterium]
MLLAIINGAIWLSVYFGIVVFATLFFLTGDVPPPRTFWIEFGVLLGFALILTISLQFALTSRFRGVGAPFGTDAVLQFHRYAGILLLFFLVGHPFILFFADSEYLKFLDPRENAPRAITLVIATITMTLIVVLSLWRKSIGLSYEWWRLSHGLMSVGVVLVGIVHAWQVEHYVQGWWKRGLLVLIGGSAIFSYAHVRCIRPWRMRRFRYRVAEVRDERGESATIALEPIGHAGMTFRAGQYAWLTLGDSSFKLQQNPYSFSSSDQLSPGLVEFTAKELGDFSERLIDSAVGTQAFLEGPYGLFCLDDDSPGAIFIMGGIGITPAISILRSARDRSDQRPFLVIYGNATWDGIAFRNELESLKGQINLRIVHVLSDPEWDWQGEKGYISQEVLQRHISDQERDYPVFVCGPEPMMDSVEKALLAMGISLHQIRAERFDIV